MHSVAWSSNTGDRAAYIYIPQSTDKELSMPKINGITVTQSQADVYRVIKSIGKPLPDHALVPLAQHVAPVHQSSSGIRSRRKELTDLGLVKQVGNTTTASGRTARTFKVAR